MFFYIAVYVLALMQQTQYLFYLATLSVLGSVYLAYISYFKLKNYCLVCTTIYLVNILLFITAYIL